MLDESGRRDLGSLAVECGATATLAPLLAALGVATPEVTVDAEQQRAWEVLTAGAGAHSVAWVWAFRHTPAASLAGAPSPRSAADRAGDPSALSRPSSGRGRPVARAAQDGSGSGSRACHERCASASAPGIARALGPDAGAASGLAADRTFGQNSTHTPSGGVVRATLSGRLGDVWPPCPE